MGYGACDIRRQVCGPQGGSMGCGCGPQGGSPNYPQLPPAGVSSLPNARSYQNGMGMGGWNGGMPNQVWQAAQQILSGYGPLSGNGPIQGNSIYFGLDSGATAIAAGATATLTTSPQVRNIPKQISVSQAVGTAFAISSILIGVAPVLATSSNISAAIFIEDSTANPFKSQVLEVGMDFSMTVTNVSANPIRFLATIVGTDLACFPC